jgi:hypothetical protein
MIEPVNYHKRCILTLHPIDEGKPFDVIVYGCTARDLMTTPNPVISSLARRYPGYYSSMFS